MLREDSKIQYLVAGVIAFVLVLGLTSILFIPLPSYTIRRSKLQSINLDDFVDRWLDVSIGDLSDGYTLDYLCNRRNTSWQKNVIINVHDANGGIGNVRGNVLDFVYFAIATGSSIILPSFAARSKSDISSLWDGRIPFNTFFDEQHFIQMIRASCPDLHIYDPDQQGAMKTLADSYNPTSLRSDLSDSPPTGVEAFHSWLSIDQQITLPPHSPTLINVGRTLWDGPDTRSFTPKVRRDFGSLLKMQPNVRRLAAIATYNLAHRFRLDINPSLLYYPSAYLGAHLRTETDAAQAGWLFAAHANFSAQTDAYLSQARERKLKVIYAASGSREDLDDFAEQAWKMDRFNVTHKHDLLTGTDLGELQGLSWDQQALVDFEILLRCSYFGGFVKSSFSYNIAIARQAVLEMEGRVVEKRWGEIDPSTLDLEDEKAFHDRGSVIWGRDEWHERKIPRGAWP